MGGASIPSIMRLRLLATSCVVLLSLSSADRMPHKHEPGHGPIHDNSCKAPLQMELRYGLMRHRAIADQICCRNKHDAEPSGLFASKEVDFFQNTDKTGQTTVYDSVCGMPLFKAPIGRTFEEWREESIAAGWLSFRSEEMQWPENLYVHMGGEITSICGTHIGYDIPNDNGPRFMANLACIAGEPGVEHR